MTCSPACRTMACRRGTLKELRSLAKGLDISLAAILHAKAMQLLSPELSNKAMAGEIKLYDDDVLEAVGKEFLKRAMAVLQQCKL